MPARSKRQRILAYRREDAWILASKTNQTAYVARKKADGSTHAFVSEKFPDATQWDVLEVVTPAWGRRELAPPSLRHLHDEREQIRGACTRTDEEGERFRKRFQQLTDVIGDAEPTPQPHWPEGGDHWHPDPADEESKVTASPDDDDRASSPQEESPGHDASASTCQGCGAGYTVAETMAAAFICPSCGKELEPRNALEGGPDYLDLYLNSSPKKEATKIDWPETGKLSDEQANTLRRYREKIERENLPTTAAFTPREMNAYTSTIRALARRGLLTTGDIDKDIMDRRYSPATKRDMERRAADEARETA